VLNPTSFKFLAVTSPRLSGLSDKNTILMPRANSLLYILRVSGSANASPSRTQFLNAVVLCGSTLSPNYSSVKNYIQNNMNNIAKAVFFIIFLGSKVFTFTLLLMTIHIVMYILSMTFCFCLRNTSPSLLWLIILFL